MTKSESKNVNIAAFVGGWLTGWVEFDVHKKIYRCWISKEKAYDAMVIKGKTSLSVLLKETQNALGGVVKETNRNAVL